MRKKNIRKMKIDVPQQQVVEEFIITEYDTDVKYCANNVPKEEQQESSTTTIDASPHSSNNHSILSQETIMNASDSSTADADEKDNANDDQFTYLQNLNSDNLMKFSQQSVLQQLLQEHVTVKPNLNLLPNDEEHDNGGYNFRIKVDCEDSNYQRSGVVYSKKTNRLYLKTNENAYIDCFFTQKMPIQQLKIRVFVIFEKDASIPVLRCQNHISTDNDPNQVVRRSLVRCKNPGALYYGSDTGKSINDRYSVVVPLNSTVKCNKTNQLKQQLIVSFTCYNSCMNRKQTLVVFLLEGMYGEILAQRTLSLKISTCPKRDRRLYECPGAVNLKGRKRHLDALPEANYGGSEAKLAKYENTSIKDEYSRSSFDETSDDGVNTTFASSVHFEEESGEFVLQFRYNSHQQLLRTVGLMYGNAIQNELVKSAENGKTSRHSHYLKKLFDSAYNLRSHKHPPPSTSTE